MPHPIQPGGGGGGGVPALPFTSVQFNNAGAFGGSPNFTWNGTGVSIGNSAGVANRKLSVYNTGTDLGASVVTLAASDNVLNTFVSGEAQNRYAVDGGGSTVWGAGGASAPDARLRRTTTSTLQVDDNAGGSATLIVLGQTKTQQRAVAVTTRNAAYNVQSNDDVVLCDPIVPFDVTLPSAALVIGRRVTIKRISTSANVITVKSAGGTIDLVAAGTGIALPGGTLNSITVIADGINWWII